ncbi:universal stress protein [Pontibacter sp. SGAir0037]|uniref:universal stress protein n=1 Tax=Pontibacter sp. SGAir0037 TaxID=2571030 RepID=UPI0010CCE747|nr:universal stress protein [Pontibacter sp. SGAir0037]QCR21791.1 universal stress protein UspA [Pontibacter sp. SGAir0037]
MKRILVPTDFSDQARNAYEVALSLAQRTGAAIKLLHVVEVPYPTTDFSATGDIITGDGMSQVYILNLLEIAKGRMQKLKELAQAYGVDVVDEVDTDDMIHKIKSTAQKDQIDLVVMGSKGSSGLEEFFIGSNTEKIVREANCPVLTIKKQEADFVVKNIVLASDLKVELGTAIEKFKAFQALFDATLHLVYINTPGDFEPAGNLKKQMEATAEKYGLQNYTLNIYNDAIEEDGILHFAQEIKADLIMLATHGRTGLSHLLSGSIAEDLVNHTSLPVLTVHLH